MGEVPYSHALFGECPGSLDHSGGKGRARSNDLSVVDTGGHAHDRDSVVVESCAVISKDTGVCPVGVCGQEEDQEEEERSGREGEARERGRCRSVIAIVGVGTATPDRESTHGWNMDCAPILHRWF